MDDMIPTTSNMYSSILININQKPGPGRKCKWMSQPGSPTYKLQQEKEKKQYFDS